MIYFYDEDIVKICNDHGPYVRNFGYFLGEESKQAFESHDWDDSIFAGDLPAGTECKVCGAEFYIIQMNDGGRNTYISEGRGIHFRYSVIFVTGLKLKKRISNRPNLKIQLYGNDHKVYNCGEVCIKDIIT